MRIGSIILRSVKNGVLRIVRIPEKTKWKVYCVASQGKIPFSDKSFQKWDYRIHSGRRLSFRNPKTYQEKLQWLKYYYHNPIMTTLVDKYRCREYVADKIGEEHLVPLFGKYNSFDEIDFSALPKEFVLKCNHDSGSVAICKNKETFDFQAAKELLTNGLARNQFYLSREWPYKNVQPCIICEKLLKDDQFEDIQDYKFFCFDGKVRFFAVYTDRHSDMKITYYYPGWERIPVKLCRYPVNPQEDFHPKYFDTMLEYAEQLSKGFPEVRVDFYYVNDEIYFGEMTFFSSGGRLLWEPDEYNYKFGEWIKLPPKMR